MSTYGDIVEVRQQKENTEHRDETQEDRAHRCPATRAGVHFAAAVPSECWQ